MARARVGRVGLALGAASLLIAGLFAGTAQAGNPAGWSMTVVQQPPGVQNGELAGFVITIKNDGPSNISQFFFVDSSNGPTVIPSYLTITGSESFYTCNSGADLKCNIGPMNPGDFVVITVAYTTQASGATFTYTPEANTTGVPVGSNKSHGDSLFNSPKTLTTALSTNKNFGGKFLAESGDVSNVAISGNNKQQSLLLALPAGIGASVEDALPDNAFSCSPACNGSFLGEWTRFIVDNGRPQGTPFHAVMIIKASVQDSQLAGMVAYHVLDDNTVVVIGDSATQTPGGVNGPTERCASADAPNDPLAADGCIIASKVGGNLRLDFWLTQNGGIRK